MQIREASVVLQRDWERTGAAARLVAVPDRTIDESETDVEQRMEAMKGVEAALAERTSTACEILAAADERDAVADARDLAADRREHDLDLAQFLAVGGDDYGHDWPERRAAALDRRHAKQDRIAARRDRMALAHDRVWAFDHPAEGVVGGTVCPSSRAMGVGPREGEGPLSVVARGGG
jgi:hypothetical protein